MAMRNWSTLLIILGLLFMSSLVRGQTPAEYAGAEEIIAHANALGIKKDFDGAINLLTSAVERFPAYAHLYLSLANWQEIRGLEASTADASSLQERETSFHRQLSEYPDTARDIFETYARATMFVPDTGEIRQHIAELTAQDFPLQLGELGPLALPGDPIPVTYTVRDPRLPVEKRGMYQGIITSRPLPIIPASPGDPDSGLRANFSTDPEYGKNPDYTRDPVYGNWRFDNILYAYDFDKQNDCWNLRFRIMWQDVPGQEENRARFARHCAQLLLRLSGLLHIYTGLSPMFSPDGAINVWLSEKGDPGGEAIDENIYLMGIGVHRSPGEWEREVAHEFGHETLPVVGGYVKPEWASNGILGERLFTRWLLLNADLATETHPWIRALNPDQIKETRIDRFIRQFAGLGPESPAMTAKDGTAMDAFIGMALYVEETQGSDCLASALKTMTTPAFSGPNGFLQAVEYVARSQQSAVQPVVTLQLTDMPAHMPLWVYLIDGNWQGQIETRDNATLAVKANVDGKELPLDLTGHFTTGNLNKGWHCICLVPDDKAPDDLVSLTLAKQ